LQKLVNNINEKLGTCTPLYIIHRETSKVKSLFCENYPSLAVASLYFVSLRFNVLNALRLEKLRSLKKSFFFLSSSYAEGEGIGTIYHIRVSPAHEI
jgi:hypothetical protein